MMKTTFIKTTWHLKQEKLFRLLDIEKFPKLLITVARLVKYCAQPQFYITTKSPV